MDNNDNRLVEEIYTILLNQIILSECFEQHHLAKSNRITYEELYNVKDIGIIRSGWG